MSTFTGFSEEDLKRIKSGETRSTNGTNKTKYVNHIKIKNENFKVKNITIGKQTSDDDIEDMEFEKCRLSIKSTFTPSNQVESSETLGSGDQNENITVIEPNDTNQDSDNSNNEVEEGFANYAMRKQSVDTPDIVRGVDLTEDEMATHRGKIIELQLKQKLMEEQNKKRKEMLSKALADRTRQTEEEVLKLEKIKKELQVLDGQFSQDVNVLRKKIDHACISYAEAEKTYLKVEKEFLHAKIQLQKEKEKKELLTEHLCALITHNETRKAQKLETLMLELASKKKNEGSEVTSNDVEEKDGYGIVVDGVDERTGKMVEIKTED